MKKILFLCEGNVAEPNLVNKIKEFFLKDETYELVSYGTNIYDLYEKLKNDEYLNVIDLVKQQAIKRKQYEIAKKLNEGFAEIYLFFDFDPHDKKFLPNKIIELMNIFDNETENGKLYINYPMIESFKHFESIPDSEYVNYKINKFDCSSYKNKIDSFLKKSNFNIKKMKYDEYGIITMQNILKSARMLKIKINDYDDYISKLDLKNILNYEIDILSKTDYIYVLNTMCFWPIDYFNREKARKIYQNFSKKFN